MSQEKVDRYKQEKYNRKNVKKKKNVKKVLSYIAVTIIAIAFVIYLGYSVAVSTGLYTPPTTAPKMSQQEIESLRQKLIDNKDPNVQGVETTTATTSEAVTAEGQTVNAKKVTPSTKKATKTNKQTKKTK